MGAVGAVGEQVERGRNFNDLANELPRPTITEMPMEKTVGLDELFDHTWRCINNNDARIIGIWGQGGVGKTTLLKKINNEFVKHYCDINKVIWVVVSKDGTAENVQRDIARMLGLPIDT